MDAFVPALIAALLAGFGDRPAAYAAALGARGRASAAWGIALSLASALTIAIGAVFGAVLQPLLTPEARGILLAGALLAAGVAALIGGRREETPSGIAAAVWIGALARAAGDRTGLIVFALAARGPSSLLSGLGALAGAAALTAIALAAGTAWRQPPLPALGKAAGGLLVLAGLVIGVGALRLT